MNIIKVVKTIKKDLKEYVVGYKEISGSNPVYKEFKFKSKELNEFLNKINFKLYKHQAEALEVLYSGKNIVVTTPTASGKSEIFRLYILDTYLSNKLSTFLLIFPTRALLYDQYEKFINLIRKFEEISNTELGLKVSYLLGDLNYKEKVKLCKENPNVIFTTIDNLHLFILKNHDKFHFFLKNLKAVVVDEVHTYRGVFGSNSAYVFRRLFRLLKYFYKNNSFKIIALSATLKNSREFAEKLFGISNFIEIKTGYHPRKPRYILLIDPKHLKGSVILKKIIDILLRNKIKSIIFIESKKGVELTKLSFKSKLIYPYKGSLPKEKRREIENKFKKGEILILVSTSALELGIDVGDVNCVVNYGVPPDGIFSIIQRFGRSGRKQPGINILIFKKDSLDFYYVLHKKEFFEKIEKGEVDEVPVNLDNENIVEKHLLYLINEFKRLSEDLLSEREKKIINKLTYKGIVKKSKNLIINKDYFYLNDVAINYSGLRSISDDVFYLVEDDLNTVDVIKNLKKEKSALKVASILKSKGKIIEEMDKYAFYNYLLPGMVYYSLGKAYRVKYTKTIGKVSFVILHKCKDFIETYPIYQESVRILDIISSKTYKDLKIYLGKIEVNRKYYGYIEKKIEEESKEFLVNYYESDIEYSFKTKGVWIVFNDKYRRIQEDYEMLFSNKLKKCLEKESKIELWDYLTNIADSVDKEYFYEKYKGGSTKILYEVLRKYVEKFDFKSSKEKVVFLLKKLVDSKYAFRSGLHAIEHNLIKISSVVTNIDSKELGGYSYEFYSCSSLKEEFRSFVGKPIIFIYEGYEGGVGLSEILYKNIENLLKESKNLLFKCKCLDGCPKCIFSSKCGNFNEFLDKYAARLIYKKIDKQSR